MVQVILLYNLLFYTAFLLLLILLLNLRNGFVKAATRLCRPICDAHFIKEARHYYILVNREGLRGTEYELH